LQCDALRPCTTCTTRQLVCQYETERGETTVQAAKRKHEQTASELETYETLFRMIETQDQRSAADIVRWIRAGYSAGDIVQHANTTRVVSMLDPQALAIQAFLVNLAHSTGSLRQIVRFATSISTSSTAGQIPNPLEFQVLCDRIVRFSYMEDMLQISQRLNPARPLLLNGGATRSSDHARDMIAMPTDLLLDDDTGVLGSPPYRVPALPWTTITTDDDSVSHLVSHFLNWVNPGWRFVEADLFLKGTSAPITFWNLRTS
jgi:hypothetical protein